jgi:DNA repair protein RadD
MAFKLRPYQRQSIDDLLSYWGAGNGNPLIVLPTGAGKSLVIAALCQELLRDFPKMRIGIVTHIRELIKQDYDELLALWPQAPAGIYSAGMNRRDTSSQILFCGIQSVWKRTREIGPFDLLMVDEAHLVPRSASTTYRKFIDRLRDDMPDMRVVGLTATAFRLDSGLLHEGNDAIFNDIVYDANVRDLIEQGYLAPLLSKGTVQKMDVSGVGRRGGDFIPGQLEIAVDQDWITRGAVDEIMKYGAERRAWLAFCSGVSHAGHVCEEIRKRGISCETIVGDTPKEDRNRIIEAFRNGHIRCLTSVMVLATGFNVPHVDMIALLRPTQSAGLFVQQVGRGLRNATGKTDCLILDFAGNTKRHGPIDTVEGKGESKASSEDREEEEKLVKAKDCPKCLTLVRLYVMKCPTCGHEWPAPVPKHEAVADASTPIISVVRPEWIEVDGMSCHRHLKAGSPDSLCITYRCGLIAHREWICLEHDGYANQRAMEWWRKSAGTTPPETVGEALTRQHEIRIPSEIRVSADGRFFKIDARRFARVTA